MNDRSWPSENRNGAISAEQRIKGSKTHQVKEFRLREEGKKKLRRRTGGTLLDRTDRVPFSPIKMAHFLAGPDKGYRVDTQGRLKYCHDSPMSSSLKAWVETEESQPEVLPELPRILVNARNYFVSFFSSLRIPPITPT